MPYQDLSKFGYTPKGASSGALLEGILTGAEKFVDSYVEGEQNRQKKEKDRADTFVALRKAGYSKTEAYDALKRGITKATISPKEDTSYETKGGYDKPDDIPQTKGGLPLSKITQDKKSGKWFGEYKQSTKTEDSFFSTMDLNTPAKTTPKSKWNPPGWLSKIIGTFEGVSEEPITSTKGPAEKYSAQQNAIIAANMKQYKKSRAEVVEALKKKGLL